MYLPYTMNFPLYQLSPNKLRCLYSCSFLEPRRFGDEVNDRSGGTMPAVWNANCGGIFGPELMFSRALELEMGQQKPFEAVKNARGGTKIYKHWYPHHGKYWFHLQSSIRSRKGYGNFRAFIWQQGINGMNNLFCANGASLDVMRLLTIRFSINSRIFNRLD